MLLALLSNKQLSRPFHKAKARRIVKAIRKKASLEQILLVPHTELAKQFEGWIARLRIPPSPEDAELSDGALDVKPQLAHQEPAYGSMATAKPPLATFPALRHTQILHRQSSKPIDIATRFLITTPRYLIDLLDSVSTEHLHTIALDEADEMLKLPNRFHTHKDEAKWLRHPPLLLAIMDKLLSLQTQDIRQNDTSPEKRIVAVSASANSVFRDYIVRRSGWLKAPSAEKEETVDGHRRFDWYDFSSTPVGTSEHTDDEQLSNLQKVGRSLMPQARINHYLVRVDAQGEFANENTPRLPTSSDRTTPSADANRYLVATATLFALKQVERGLLLIPSSQSLKATLEFLHSVAVPAVGISEAFDSSKHATDTVLYVASVDSVRGLDIPQLEWIFLTPEIKAQRDTKDYMHVSGRVGRLLDSQGTRGSGNVVSLVDFGNPYQEVKLRNVWQLLGIEGKAMSPEELALPDVLVETEET